MGAMFEGGVVERREALVDLLARIAAQDRAAFADFYRVTSAKLYGVVARILGRGALAEEVMQEVYVKIWKRAADFDPSVASPIAWIAAIARNRALDEARRASIPIANTPDGFDLPGESIDPLAGREHNESLRALLKCLSNLEQEKREIILLAYYSGLSREALASRFSRPVSTIKTWLHRGLAQLKSCMSQ